MLNTGNVVPEKSSAYALDIIRYTEELEANKKLVIANPINEERNFYRSKCT